MNMCSFITYFRVFPSVYTIPLVHHLKYFFISKSSFGQKSVQSLLEVGLTPDMFVLLFPVLRSTINLPCCCWCGVQWESCERSQKRIYFRSCFTCWVLEIMETKIFGTYQWRVFNYISWYYHKMVICTPGDTTTLARSWWTKVFVWHSRFWYTRSPNLMGWMRYKYRCAHAQSLRITPILKCLNLRFFLHICYGNSFYGMNCVHRLSTS